MDQRRTTVNAGIFMCRAVDNSGAIKARVVTLILLSWRVQETVRNSKILSFDELRHAFEGQVVDAVVVTRYPGHSVRIPVLEEISWEAGTLNVGEEGMRKLPARVQGKAGAARSSVALWWAWGEGGWCFFWVRVRTLMANMR